jgi:NADPH2:quinone reductase
MAGHSALSKLKALWSALNFGVVAPLGLLDRSQSLLGLNVLRVADHQPERLSLAFKAIHELVAQGEIEARVGATFPIREVAQAHELLESRQSIGKIVLRW